jgi:16S rRNA (cytosine1402-N4)-methyltransferase
MHVPVMKDEFLAACEQLARSPLWFLDATYGRGGHTRAFHEKYPDAQLVAMDRDPSAIAHAQQSLPQARALQGSFADFEGLKAKHLNGIGPGFDVILMDLGVSSPQLDEAPRGFSFYQSGPLDMRMNPQEPLSAAEIVNSWDAEDLFALFQTKGEIQRPGRVVNAIVEFRRQKPFLTTQELAQLIEKNEGWRQRGQHPATRFFMALRLEVNQELEQVSQHLSSYIQALAPGGRLIVITFHSLEDRIVKYILKGSVVGRLVNKKVIKPTREEQLRNPRARSAKMRIFERSTNESTTVGGV